MHMTNMQQSIIINVPPWARIVNYRTMTDDKKALASAGNKLCQYEWMVEEANEFYEAAHSGDPTETRDEAMGLIRTVQQFRDSKRVVALWKKVRESFRRANYFWTRLPNGTQKRGQRIKQKA